MNASPNKRRLTRHTEERDPNCSQCGLWESAETVCMWGQGPARASVMVVTEAPTQAADSTGKLMGGPPGKLLRELLEEAGVELSDCYITHSVKCKPPEGGSPSASELKVCKQYLTKEIHSVTPQFILSLGASALKSLHKGKITELHGQPIEQPGYTLFPTFHPAMALRDPSKLPALRGDLMRFGKLVRGDNLVQDPIHYEVIRTLGQWNSFIEEFSQSPEFSFDCETTGLDENAPRFKVKFGREGFEGPSAINSLQIGLASGRNFSIPLEVRDSPWKGKHSQQRMFIETLVDLQRELKLKAVAWNGKFDNRWLTKVYGVKFFLDFDGMLAHHTLDENSPHGLKEVAVAECDAPAYDVDLKTKLGLGELEPFYRYGCEDVYWTLKLYYIFRKRILQNHSLRRLFYQLVMRSARMFESIEANGLYVDLSLLGKTEKRLIHERDELLCELNEIARDNGVDEVNWGSPAQVGGFLFEALGLPILEKTPKGEPSTSESVLMRLKDQSPVAELMVKIRGVEKNLSTYVLGWKELMHGPYLYLSTKLHGTVTGRYASRLHQVPRDPSIRSHITAPPGWTLVVADYSQIELRLAAMLSGDQRMMMIFQTGGDIHSATASEITGIDPGKLTKEQRKMGKPVNFGFLYGMWWKKFKDYARDNYGVIFSDEQSKKYRERFFEVYSSLSSWHERMRRTVRLFGEVASLSGRLRRLPGVYSIDKTIQQEAERQAINSPVQGFGSGDLKAMAMVEIHDTFDPEQLRIVGEVHDSILMWIRTEYLGEIIPQVKGIMEDPQLLTVFKIKMTVPLVADFEVGPWGIGEKWEF